MSPQPIAAAAALFQQLSPWSATSKASARLITVLLYWELQTNKQLKTQWLQKQSNIWVQFKKYDHIIGCAKSKFYSLMVQKLGAQIYTLRTQLHRNSHPVHPASPPLKHFRASAVDNTIIQDSCSCIGCIILPFSMTAMRCRIQG